MSLEWARARLLEHAEALRKRCEAQAQQLAAERLRRRRAAVVALRPRSLQGPVTQATETGTVLKFEAGRRRLA